MHDGVAIGETSSFRSVHGPGNTAPVVENGVGNDLDAIRRVLRPGQDLPGLGSPMHMVVRKKIGIFDSGVVVQVHRDHDQLFVRIVETRQFGGEACHWLDVVRPDTVAELVGVTSACSFHEFDYPGDQVRVCHCSSRLIRQSDRR